MVIWGEGNNDNNNSNEIVHFGVYAKNMARFSEVTPSTDFDNALILGSDGSDFSRTFSFQAVVNKLKTIFSVKDHSHPWSAITGKPATFDPAAHNHSWESITGKPTTFTPASHSHTPDEAGAAPAIHNHAWSDIIGKPSSFTPSSHGHPWSNISGAPAGCSIGMPGTGSTGSERFNDGNNIASANFSHAEGGQTIASGTHSHAEGHKTTASGPYSHAEGEYTTASGEYSHAGGRWTVASGKRSTAIGYETIADYFDSFACGSYNRPVAQDSVVGTSYSDSIFYIGASQSSDRSNAFRVTREGKIYANSNYNSSGADYAEYFEWLDENSEGQDRVGYFVTLEGKKIKQAGPGDYILGVVSGNPCIIGNADEDWLGRWLHDGFDRYLREYLEESEELVEIPVELEDAELLAYLRENHIEERDGSYYKKTVTVVDHETPLWRYKQNPAYDPSQTYIERKDRPEWAAVGMMGVLAVWDNGSCQVDGFCQVAQGGIATAAEGYVPGMTWRVIERIAPNIVKIVFR